MKTQNGLLFFFMRHPVRLIWVLLLLIGIFMMTAAGKTGTNAIPSGAYSDGTEHTIIQMVRMLTGDENAYVMVFTEQQVKTDSSIFASSAQTESTGDITGIAVFCHDGENAAVQLELCRMLKQTFGISAAHVYIGQGTADANAS